LDKFIRKYNHTYKYAPIPHGKPPFHGSMVKYHILYKFICALVVSLCHNRAKIYNSCTSCTTIVHSGQHFPAVV